MLAATMPRAKTVAAQGFPEANALQPLVVKPLGLTRFEEAAAAMRAFTAARDADTPDEIWLTEHAPVYTLGLAGKHEHILNPGGIPVVQTDRGGQVTYHAPGQVVAYVLVDLRRRGITVRRMVTLIEAAVLATLVELGPAGHRRAGMPGVYVGDVAAGDKIAALGLKVKHGCTYHGVSLNVDLDLAPFGGINPCGYEGLRVTSLKALGMNVAVPQVGERLAAHLEACLIQAPVVQPTLS